jgi:hypothetical protein
MRPKRGLMLIFILGVSLLSCRFFVGTDPTVAPGLIATEAVPTRTRTPLVVVPAATRTSTVVIPAATTIPTLTRTPTSIPISTITPSPSPVPTLEPSPAPPDEDAFTVRLHPDGPLYIGDQVSFEVIAPAGLDMSEQELYIRSDPPGLEIGPVKFGPFGIASRIQATVIWAWDTSSLDAGSYDLTYSLEPAGLAWTETVALHPEEEVPPPEPEAQWASVETQCCIIYYITGTEAERDLPDLIAQTDRQAERAVQQLHTEFEESITISLLPRVLGHGGFAGQEISISYLDRNYAGSDYEMVLHHEMIHILDGRLGGEFKPSILVEGLAVYLSGGHFKPEQIMPRAAALLELPGQGINENLGWYIPLGELADDFYASQHEIGYLQGAALTQYMIERWGWEDFDRFYRGMKPPENGSHLQAMEAGLEEHLGITLAALEQDFLKALRRELVTADHVEDVYLTVAFFDTVRRYQQALDSSAYFRTAWLLDNQEMRRRGIVADYLRRPSEPENISIELLLVAANGEYLAGRYLDAERYLQAANAALDYFWEVELDLQNTW